MSVVRVDIIAYAPTAFFHCQHCEIAFHQLGIGRRLRRSEASESLPPDLQAEYADLSAWVHELHGRMGDRVAVRLIDAASLAGVWYSLRHGVRSYPAVVVEGRDRRVGGRDYRELDPVIDRLASSEGGKG